MVQSPKVVTQFALESLKFLLGKSVKLVVIACNTISATCLDKLTKASPVPVIGVIEPGARAAVATTKNQIIGVIGTERTISSRAYEQAIHTLNGQINIYSKACPLFAILVEEGWLKRSHTTYCQNIFGTHERTEY